ncbi:MAG: hypothetical protein KJ053_02355 [Dehalococcoidia bacterium]|nr:hypothetical protein [Dehalococcoidia bacterium]
MHDSPVHGSCDECASFVAVFPKGTPHQEWGYCRTQQPAPPATELAPLIEAFLAGDRAPLRQNNLGVFRTEEDDACDFFEHKQL